MFYFYQTNYQQRERILEFKKIGFTIILCDCKTESGSFNIDTDLCITAVEEFFECGERHDLLLVSGDGDFVPLLKFYEEYGFYTEIISSTKKLDLQGSCPTSKKLKSYLDDNGDEVFRNISYYDEINASYPDLLSLTRRL